MKKINFTTFFEFALLIGIFTMMCNMSIEMSRINKTIKIHDKITLEALACVDDPFCKITIGNLNED